MSRLLLWQLQHGIFVILLLSCFSFDIHFGHEKNSDWVFDLSKGIVEESDQMSNTINCSCVCWFFRGIIYWLWMLASQESTEAHKIHMGLLQVERFSNTAVDPAQFFTEHGTCMSMAIIFGCTSWYIMCSPSWWFSTFAEMSTCILFYLSLSLSIL